MMIMFNEQNINDRFIHQLKNAIRISPRTRQIIDKLIQEALSKKSRIPLIQLYRKITAILVQTLCVTNSFDHNIQIQKTILTQHTYRKTLTSRP